MFIGLNHVTEIVRDCNRLIRCCVKADHDRTTLTLYCFCSCVDSPLDKRETFVSQTYDRSFYIYLVRIEHGSDEICLYVCHHDSEAVIYVIAYDIKQILGLAGIEKLEIYAVVDMAELIDI